MSNSDGGNAPPARRTASTRRRAAAAATAAAASTSTASTAAADTNKAPQPGATREQIDEILHQLLDTPRRNAPATVPHSAPHTFQRKIPLHNEPQHGSLTAAASPLVLQTTWPPTPPAPTTSTTATNQLEPVDPLAAVELLLLNCETGAAHIGHITHASMRQSAARLELDAAEYVAEMRLMLTGIEPLLTVDTCPDQPQQHLDALEARLRTHLFELTPSLHTQRERAGGAGAELPAATSSSSSTSQSGSGQPPPPPPTPPFLTLTWRKRVAERVTVVYGAVLLQPQPDAAGAAPVAAQLLAAAVDKMESRAEEQRLQRCESAVLLRNQRMLAVNFERCLAVRMENEQAMLKRFMALLSAKKTRIEELQLVLRTGQAEYDAEVARLNGEAWTATAAALQEGDVAADVAAVLSDMESRGAVGGGGDDDGSGKDDANSNGSDDSVFSETQSGPATVEEARAAAKRAKFSLMRVADDDVEEDGGGGGGSQRKFRGIGGEVGAASGDRDSPVDASAVADRRLPHLASMLPRRLAAVVAEASRSTTRRTLSGGVHLEQPPSSPAQPPLADDDEDHAPEYDCDTEPMADD